MHECPWLYLYRLSKDCTCKPRKADCPLLEYQDMPDRERYEAILDFHAGHVYKVLHTHCLCHKRHCGEYDKEAHAMMTDFVMNQMGNAQPRYNYEEAMQSLDAVVE